MHLPYIFVKIHKLCSSISTRLWLTLCGEDHFQVLILYLCQGNSLGGHGVEGFFLHVVVFILCKPMALTILDLNPFCCNQALSWKVVSL